MFSPLILVHAGYFPPKDVQSLIEKTEILDDKCRGGSGDDPKTMKACDEREHIIKKIEKKGYCWGIAVPQFFTRGSSFELPLVLWVFYRVKIKLLKFFFQTNSLELF